MITVRQILDRKGRDVWTVSPGAKVFDALKLMADKGIGAVVAVEGERVAGILSERDYARKIALLDRESRDTTVEEIMTSQIYVVHPETTADECMALMTDKHIRHLPVMEGERLAGVVSIGDIVKAIISEQTFTIANLENYIMGKYQ